MLCRASFTLLRALRAFWDAERKDAALPLLQSALSTLAAAVSESSFVGTAATQRGLSDEAEAVKELAATARDRGHYLEPSVSLTSADGSFSSTADAVHAHVVESEAGTVGVLTSHELKRDERGVLADEGGRLTLTEAHKLQAFMHEHCLQGETRRWNRLLAQGVPFAELPGMPAGLASYLDSKGVTTLKAAQHCMYRVHQPG